MVFGRRFTWWIWRLQCPRTCHETQPLRMKIVSTEGGPLGLHFDWGKKIGACAVLWGDISNWGLERRISHIYLVLALDCPVIYYKSKIQHSTPPWLRGRASHLYKRVNAKVASSILAGGNLFCFFVKVHDIVWSINEVKMAKLEFRAIRVSQSIRIEVCSAQTGIFRSRGLAEAEQQNCSKEYRTHNTQ